MREEILKEAPKKPRLIDIVDDFRQLLFTIGEQDGEVTADLMAQLDECEASFEKKVDSCLFISEEFSGHAETYAKRAKVLKDHADALMNQSKSLKAYVLAAMQQLNVQKMSTPSFPTVYRRKSERVVVTDEPKLIELYKDDPKIVEWVAHVKLTPLKDMLKVPDGEKNPVHTVATLQGNESLIVK